MKKTAVSDTEFMALAKAVVALPPIKIQRGNDTDYLDDVITTVLDFHMQSDVVWNGICHFREQVKHQQHIRDHQQLVTLLTQFPNTKEGNINAAQYLWGNRHWTRVELLRQLLVFFESLGITDQPSLRRWAKEATFAKDFQGKIKGMGIAVFHWLQLRSGVETTIKPDVHVINFAKRIVGRKLSPPVLIDTFSKIAPLVGESVATIDAAIWCYGKLSMATDQPELRLIAWNMLKNQLEARLREEVVQPSFNWRVILDAPEQLRYSEAGLTIEPDRSLFGETVPGTTSATIRQSHWTEGLTLEMMIRHDTSLPLPLFQQLQENLVEEYGWEAANEPNFTASLDMEDSLLMTEPMSYEDLGEWVAEKIEQAFPGLVPGCR